MNAFAPMMAMTRIEATSLAVSICVIVFLTLGFGVLFYLYYHYYRKCVDGGLEDGYLKNEIIKENPSYFKNVEAVIKDDSLTLEDLTFVKEQIDVNKRLLTVIDKYIQEPELIAENTQNKLILVPSTTGKITPLEHLKNIPIDLYPSITSLLESIKNGTFKNVRHFFTGSISEVRDLSRGTRILFEICRIINNLGL